MQYPLFSRSRLSRRSFLSRSAMGAGAVVAGAGLLEAAGDARAAGAPAGYPALNPAVVSERAQLHVWLLPELASHPAYRQAIRAFHAAYPGIQVQVTPVAKDDMLTRYKIAAAAGGTGAAPDLISYHGYILGAQGLAHESDALWSAFGRQSAFLPSAMQDVTWRIDKFGVPLISSAILTVLNADMFRKAGAPLPDAHTTFAQFTETVTRVKRAAGARYGLILSADGATATALVHANGGALFQTVQGRNFARLTDGKVVEAIRFYTELGWKQKLAPIPPTASSNRMYLAQYFAAGLAPAFFGTMSDVALIQQPNHAMNVAIAPLPGGVSGHTSGSVSDGVSLVLTGATRKPHATFELATWLVAQPPALAVAKTLRMAPTITDYYRDPYFHADRMTSTYFDVAQTATPIGLDAYTEAYDLYLGALRAAFGGQDAARAMQSIQARAQSAMDRADAGLDSDG